jgi:hypothetical protein
MPVAQSFGPLPYLEIIVLQVNMFIGDVMVFLQVFPVLFPARLEIAHAEGTDEATLCPLPGERFPREMEYPMISIANPKNGQEVKPCCS